MVAFTESELKIIKSCELYNDFSYWIEEDYVELHGAYFRLEKWPNEKYAVYGNPHSPDNDRYFHEIYEDFGQAVDRYFILSMDDK